MIAPADSVEPIDSTDSADPIDAIEPNDPIEPIESTDPRLHMHSTLSCDLIDHFEFPTLIGPSWRIRCSHVAGSARDGDARPPGGRLVPRDLAARHDRGH